jgi:hypothetical protein
MIRGKFVKPFVFTESGDNLILTRIFLKKSKMGKEDV